MDLRKNCCWKEEIGIWIKGSFAICIVSFFIFGKQMDGKRKWKKKKKKGKENWNATSTNIMTCHDMYVTYGSTGIWS